jgi:hypothetical protein
MDRRNHDVDLDSLIRWRSESRIVSPLSHISLTVTHAFTKLSATELEADAIGGDIGNPFEYYRDSSGLDIHTVRVSWTI